MCLFMLVKKIYTSQNIISILMLKYRFPMWSQTFEHHCMNNKKKILDCFESVSICLTPKKCETKILSAFLLDNSEPIQKLYKLYTQQNNIHCAFKSFY